VSVGVTNAWDPGFGEFMRSAYHYHPKNLDHNTGNPIGVSVCQQVIHDGKRVTASGAYLASSPPNLTVMTEASITKVLFQDKKAVGVQADGKKSSSLFPLMGWRTELANTSTVYAKQEVILAAGAIDSPKLLLLSGIGPAGDLEPLNIPVTKDLPGVGKNLQDRLFLELVTVQDPKSHHRTSYIDSPVTLEQAREEWMHSQTGPLSGFYLPQMIAYLKSDTVLASQEFMTLDKETQQLWQAETKPFYEMISVSQFLLPDFVIAFFCPWIVPRTSVSLDISLFPTNLRLP